MKTSLWIAAAAALAPIAPVHSYCFSPEELRSKSVAYFANYVRTNADVIIDATVVRSFDYPHPEILKTHHVYKGPKQATFTLALPRDFILTAAPPSTGLEAGERAIIALRKGKDGYLVSECDAGALSKRGVPHLLIKLASKNHKS